MATQDADIYSLFMGGQDASAQAQAQAEALRRRREAASVARNAGNVALLTGDRVLSNFGQAQLQQAAQGEGEVGRGEGLLAQAGSQFAGRQLQQALAERQAQAQARQLAETARHNRASEAMGRPPPFVIVTGEGGQQYFVDPRSPTTPAAPVMGPDGKPIAKPQTGGADTQKRVDALMERQVEGFEFAPGRLPSADSARKMQDMSAARDRLKTQVKELRDLYKRTGTNLFGEDAVLMNQLSEAITLEAKNIGELGALSGPDKGIIDRIQGSNPTSLLQNVADIFGADTVGASLDGLDKWVDNQLESSAKARGYAPTASGAAGAAPLPAGVTVVEELREEDGSTLQRLSDGTNRVVPGGGRAR